jgi:hypothetical protein
MKNLMLLGLILFIIIIAGCTQQVVQQKDNEQQTSLDLGSQTEKICESEFNNAKSYTTQVYDNNNKCNEWITQQLISDLDYDATCSVRQCENKRSFDDILSPYKNRSINYSVISINKIDVIKSDSFMFIHESVSGGVIMHTFQSKRYDFLCNGYEFYLESATKYETMMDDILNKVTKLCS